MQPFVAIILGGGPQEDAEQLARAAGAVAVLRPGQTHPTPLPPVDAVAPVVDPPVDDPVIDLAQPHAVPEENALIDVGDTEHDEPGHREPEHGLAALAGLPIHPNLRQMPPTAVVIDAAEVVDVVAMAAAVQLVLDGLRQLGGVASGGCVVASRLVTDTLKVVDGAGVLLGTADREEHRWVSAPLAGPYEMLAEVAQVHPAAAADENCSPSVRPMIQALVDQGVQVRAIPI